MSDASPAAKEMALAALAPILDEVAAGRGDAGLFAETVRRIAPAVRAHFGPAPLHAALARLVHAADGVPGPDGLDVADAARVRRAALSLSETLATGLVPAPDAASGPAPLSPPGIAARITIDPAAVARNWRRLANIARGECAAVVKADAYGLGIDSVVPALVAEGCTTFCVALEAEGIALRRLLTKLNAHATVYVLNGLFDGPGRVERHGLVPFVSSPAALAELPEGVPFALNVDTGMNRLGFTPAEALAVTRRPVLLASHFACADTPDHPLNARQEAAFAAVRAGFADVPASFANSAALLTRPETHLDLVRPGIALYGGTAAEGVAPLEPVVSLETRIVQVREAAAGETVGYGAAETLRRPSRIAIASLGYADGYLRAAGGSDHAPGAPAAVNGVRTRLLGRVSMDLVAVDVTDAPAARGDFVELFGPTVPLSEAARHAGTIDYELLTGLSRRAERRVGAL